MAFASELEAPFVAKFTIFVIGVTFVTAMFAAVASLNTLTVSGSIRRSQRWIGPANAIKAADFRLRGGGRPPHGRRRGLKYIAIGAVPRYGASSNSLFGSVVFVACRRLIEPAAAPDHLPPFSSLVTHRLCAACVLLYEGTLMTIGTVKWFNGQKGFGFIQPDDGGPDVFVHISAVERAGWTSLAEGQKISFENEKDSRSGKMSAGQLANV